MINGSQPGSETQSRSVSPAGPAQPRAGSDPFIQAVREADLVDEAALQAALQQHEVSQTPIPELLARQAPGREEAIYHLLADYIGVEFEPLQGRRPDPGVADRLSSPFALANRVAPVAREGGELVLATSSVRTAARADELATRAGEPVRVVLAPPTRLDRFLQTVYGFAADTVSELVEPTGDADQPVKVLSAEEVSIEEGLDSTQEASVTRFVNQLLVEAVRSGASDLHIEPYEHQLRVRMRLDGVLQDIPVPPAVKQLEQAIVSRVKVLGDLDIAEKRLSQDGQIRLNVLGRAVDVRVSVLPSIHGESVVLRILDRQSQFRDLGEIGMPADALASFRDVLSLAQGLVLVTGPTGSGKTTTLYAALNYVNHPGRKTITVEDPVEYRLEGITQIQVKHSIGLGFSSMLRSIVRHDPDVIMVGEIRDGETANIALNAAITGHLVLATLHTNDATTAVSRLTSMGAPRYMIASALRVVIAQRLVRLICPECRRRVSDLPREVLIEFPSLRDAKICVGAGCDACRRTGYSGRTGIFESFLVTDRIAERIADGSSNVALRAAAVEQGLVPLREAGLELVRDGRTTIDELYRVTREVAQRRTGAGEAQAPSDDSAAGESPTP